MFEVISKCPEPKCGKRWSIPVTGVETKSKAMLKAMARDLRCRRCGSLLDVSEAKPVRRSSG